MFQTTNQIITQREYKWDIIIVNTIIMGYNGDNSSH